MKTDTRLTRELIRRAIDRADKDFATFNASDNPQHVKLAAQAKGARVALEAVLFGLGRWLFLTFESARWALTSASEVATLSHDHMHHTVPGQ